MIRGRGRFKYSMCGSWVCFGFKQSISNNSFKDQFCLNKTNFNRDF